jgi:hypothetical protein
MSLVWICALAGYTLSAATQPQVSDIIRRSVANTQADWNAAPHYDFTEHDVITGKTRVVKTYRVMMIDGSPYNKLVAMNGEALEPAQAKAQTTKLRQEIARRQRETPDERRRRVARYDRERHQDNELLQEMVKAIDFKLAGEETTDGHRCYVLEGTPKPGYQPSNRETKVLEGMRGKMWIDEQTYQWVKVEADVFRPVAFGLFVAKVEPGTEFTLEQEPVAGNIWLPSHFSVRLKATILGYWSRNSTDDETYSDYSTV